MTEETLQQANALGWKIGELRQLKKDSSKADISILELFHIIERFNLETNGDFYSSEFITRIKRELQEVIDIKLGELEKQLSNL